MQPTRSVEPPSSYSALRRVKIYSMWSWNEVKSQFAAIAPKLKAGSWPALFTSLAAGAHYAEGVPGLTWAVPLTAVATHFFIVLSAHRAEEAVSALSADSSNHDLEKAFAEALRETLAFRPPENRRRASPRLRGLRRLVPPLDRRLARAAPPPPRTPPSSSIPITRPIPPVRNPPMAALRTRPPPLGRGAAALRPQRSRRLPPSPAAPRQPARTLPEATYQTLKFSVRKEELGRAWIAWTAAFRGGPRH